MNILLIYPKYPDTFWSFNHVLKFVSKKAAFPPLGLLTVASMIPDEWNKKLIDVNVTELKDSDIAWADYVFISAMVVQMVSTKEIISRCKNFHKTIVAGGPIFTTNHKEFTGVDYFVLNEAEVTLPLFLEDLKKNKPKKIYESEIRPDIKNTPLPMWRLIDMTKYASMEVQYSRGCPFNCEFCDIIIMNGRVPRTKSPEQMIAEFQSLFDSGWRGSVFVVDDNFIGNKANVKNMLLRLIEWQKKHNFPFTLFTEATINLADDLELMNMMIKANFSSVFLGIESPHEDSLNECGKFQNTQRNLAESVRTIHRNGLQVMAGFIVGFDSDKDSIFDAQINFIQNAGIVTAMVGLLNAIPQTRLWHRLKSEGRLVKQYSGENTDGTINFKPLMDEDKLKKGYKKILRTIYSRKNYYRRIDIFLKDYQPKFKERLSKCNVKAFIRSMWDIGILSKSRYLYWKLLIKTALTNAKAFPVAVHLAIYGQHFEKISNKILSS